MEESFRKMEERFSHLTSPGVPVDEWLNWMIKYDLIMDIVDDMVDKKITDAIGEFITTCKAKLSGIIASKGVYAALGFDEMKPHDYMYLEKAHSILSSVMINNETRKIIINRNGSSFTFSLKARERYSELTGMDLEKLHEMLYEKQCEEDNHWEEGDDAYSEIRIDPIWIKIVEELGWDASEDGSNLQVIEIPADVKWHIGKFEGDEWIIEKHRRWGI